MENAPEYFLRSISGELKTVTILSRKQVQDNEWAETFRRNEAQNLPVHMLGSNAYLKISVKQDLSDLSSAQKLAVPDVMFVSLPLTRLVSQYSVLTSQDEGGGWEQMAAAGEKQVNTFPDTDEYDMRWWLTAPIDTICIQPSRMGQATSTAGTAKDAEQHGVHCVSNQDLGTSSVDCRHYRLTLFNNSDARTIFPFFTAYDPQQSEGHMDGSMMQLGHLDKWICTVINCLWQPNMWRTAIENLCRNARYVSLHGNQPTSWTCPEVSLRARAAVGVNRGDGGCF